MDNLENEFEDLGPSKTQLKNDMLALQEIGKALTKFSTEKLARIPMSEKLRDAILEAPGIKKHSSIRRHMQYIGKLMRNDDSQAIVAAYEELQQNEQNAARKNQQVEVWRDHLLNGDKGKLAEFLESFPQTDRQQLNQLLRLCQKDASQQKNLGNSKKLFRFLRDIIVTV